MVPSTASLECSSKSTMRSCCMKNFLQALDLSVVQLDRMQSLSFFSESSLTMSCKSEFWRYVSRVDLAMLRCLRLSLRLLFNLRLHAEILLAFSRKLFSHQSTSSDDDGEEGSSATLFASEATASARNSSSSIFSASIRALDFCAAAAIVNSASAVIWSHLCLNSATLPSLLFSPDRSWVITSSCSSVSALCLRQVELQFQ